MHIHDIFWPHHYPQHFIGHYFNEQYVVAGYVLAEWRRLKILQANYFWWAHRELGAILKPVREMPQLAGIPTEGTSLWLGMV